MGHKLMGVWAGSPQNQVTNLLTILPCYLLLPQIYTDHECRDAKLCRMRIKGRVMLL